VALDPSAHAVVPYSEFRLKITAVLPRCQRHSRLVPKGLKSCKFPLKMSQHDSGFLRSLMFEGMLVRQTERETIIVQVPCSYIVQVTLYSVPGVPHSLQANLGIVHSTGP
jgi:hypothetical protein